MSNITPKVLLATSTIVAGAVIFDTEADAAGKHRGFAYSGSSIIMKTGPRRVAIPRLSAHGGQFVVRRKPTVRSRGRVYLRGLPRYTTPAKLPRFRANAIPAQQGSDNKPSSSDVMAGICNGAGGGASSNPDGTVSCVGPDGNDVLDPVPSPD